MSTTLTFDADNTRRIVPIDIADDSIDENSESFFGQLVLVGASRVQVQPERTVINIEDNDGKVNKWNLAKTDILQIYPLFRGQIA